MKLELIDQSKGEDHLMYRCPECYISGISDRAMSEAGLFLVATPKDPKQKFAWREHECDPAAVERTSAAKAEQEAAARAEQEAAEAPRKKRKAAAEE